MGVSKRYGETWQVLQLQGSLCIFGCICFFILLLLNFSEPTKSHPGSAAVQE